MQMWDSIVTEGVTNCASQLKPRTSTMAVIGTSKSGKTTVIHSFMDNSDEPKGSLPIEYTYARRTNKHMIKDVCCIWEVEIANISFIDLLMQSENLEAISVLVVLDLSDPQKLLEICEAISEFHHINSESKTISYGLVGTKFDLFEEMEMEKKSIISRIIQYYSNVFQGIFIFFNKQDRATVKRAKDLFSSLAFNTKLSNQLKTELIHPVEQSHKPYKNQSEIEFLRQLFSSKFEQRLNKSPSQDEDVAPVEDSNFANQAIDSRRLD